MTRRSSQCLAVNVRGLALRRYQWVPRIGGHTWKGSGCGLFATLDSNAIARAEGGEVKVQLESPITLIARKETTGALNVSHPSVKRFWASARAWLYRQLNRNAAS